MSAFPDLTKVDGLPKGSVGAATAPTPFKKRGPLIGSGAVESLHAWIIQARCRLPGMR